MFPLRFHRTLCWMILLCGLILVLAQACQRSPEPSQRRSSQNDRYLVGAHYYVWYPSNFRHGFLRGRLDPPQTPAMGLYDSSDPRVAEQHIALASRYGIDFFTLNWWPQRREQNENLLKGFLQAENIDDIRFCIFFETWDLGFNNDTGATVFTDEAVDRLESEILQIAEIFFDHPSYLKIEGRPVVILYLTRTFSGKYREALQRVRSSLAERGHDPYIIGDEIFWGVISEHDDAQGRPQGGRGPQKERIRLFDAIFGYNLYCWSKTDHAGYGAQSSFVTDVQEIFREYSKAALPNVGFVPTIIPGYNDRGVRRGRDHYIIPRQWDQGWPEGSFFAKSFDLLAFPFLDLDLNMILITTWNEWNEDTAIEAMVETPPTSLDQSGEDRLFTRGYAYSGHGTRYLEILQDKVVAVSGKVLDAAGQPVPGALVSARQDSRVVGESVTTREGYYNLSRLRMPAGEYSVDVAGGADPRQVAVTAGTTARGVDFSLEAHAQQQGQ